MDTTTPAKTGAHGWPLTASKAWPGELSLTCPSCGAQDAILSSDLAPFGRVATQTGTCGHHVKCGQCGRKDY